MASSLRSILFSPPTLLSPRSLSLPSKLPFSHSLSFAPQSAAISSFSRGSRLNLVVCRSKESELRTMAADKRKVEVFDSEEDLAVALAKYTADLSAKFCQERGAFTVVLSGGSLIKSLRKLAEPPYVDSIEWSKWHVFWVDERVVPKHHVDSNYKLAFDGLLCKVPVPPGNVYAINDALNAQDAADDYETCLKQLVKNNILLTSQTTGFPKFDLMLLGMGPDGHLASLFPGHHLCSENQKWVSCITDSPKPPSERITFSFPVINSAAYNAMVVCGSGKADAVEKSLKKTESLPAGSLTAEEQLVWFLDKEAASKL